MHWKKLTSEKGQICTSAAEFYHRSGRKILPRVGNAVLVALKSVLNTGKTSGEIDMTFEKTVKRPWQWQFWTKTWPQ